MMIYNPNPKNWRELQNNVCSILKEVGISAETDITLQTPRGKVAIDVWGIDENSIDQIKYAVECKSWKNKIPQSVIHSFTTVMHETGANIGYIISKNGVQKGAKSYITNTNITALTFSEFQERYFIKWFKNFFCKKVEEMSDSFIQYSEFFNSRRDRYADSLPKKSKIAFDKLVITYMPLSFPLISLSFLSWRNIEINDIEKLKEFLQEKIKLELKSKFYRDLLSELEHKIGNITREFNFFLKRTFLKLRIDN